MLSITDFKSKNIMLCFTAEGHQARIRNDNVIIEEKKDDDSNQIILQLSCLKIFSLWIIGHANLTSGILQASKKYGFSIVMFSHGFRPYGIWNSGVEGNFLLRTKQYKHHDWELAKHLVKNKIQNQIVLIKNLRQSDEYKAQAVYLLNKQLEQLPKANELNKILAIEGCASKIFFNYWFRNIPWYGRKPRTKIDFLNTTLDIGYTLLFSYIEAMLLLYGFDIYQGVYHRNFYQRKSLVCDLIEPFRCIIDKAVKNAYNLNQLKREDFLEIRDKWYLKHEKNKDYTKWLMENILNYKEDIFLYIQQYYRCFMREKEIDKYPTFLIHQ